MSTAKRVAGEAAAELVEDGMRLGLGTGSTVAYFLDALAARGLDVAGVPTSEATATRCRELGIRLLDVATTDALDLAVDGADELDAGLELTKGGGGALLREKVVAALADRFVVIATRDKLVDRLGDTFPVPVEVVPFALGPVGRVLTERGFELTERTDAEGRSYRTDNGNAILDARMPAGIADPAVTDVALALIPGVAAHGLFLDLATEALLGDDEGGLLRRSRPDRT
ncbi:ribose-5-phosphate isomerase RpiA [Egicoccus halophilus]|uniref:Ribose-5-phosphate isomerase A n=1 Tax=Egicoccus halophilus TaxID=1670830 RepID=A0A8J3EWA0_9ACTN|nr:ribose-5-phosphate isomerase RpiA [Egicoccus halophilus]GGI03130.1 ribose-5-phosphate isomerase A [Egicoccus halophilus]